MSSILQLQISGVRAFDNHDWQRLTFQSPLTLICGQNGVGKTTIIECLRYITTGDLPPNVKGGAFVHDPRMSCEAEVNAQVKLLFKSTSGQEMVATRNMRLTVSGGKTPRLTFKTLESIVKPSNSTGRNVVSARFADMNLQVPYLLGIPPSILNYVVFCHQEESLWPFGEPMAVKKRFDDIFEATKYTKALESLKATRKDYLSTARGDQRDVERAKEDELRAREKQTFLEELESKLAAKISESDSFQQQRIQKSAELENVVQHSKNIQKLEYALLDAERQAGHTRTSADSLRGELQKVLTGSLDELQQEFEASHGREQHLSAELESKTAKLTKINNDLDELRQTLAGFDNQQGRLEQLQEAVQQQKAKMNELCQNDEPSKWKTTRENDLMELDTKYKEIVTLHAQEEKPLEQAARRAEGKRLRLQQIVADAGRGIQTARAEEVKIINQIAEQRIQITVNPEILKERLSKLDAETEEIDVQLKKFVADGRVENATAVLIDAEKRADSACNVFNEVIEQANLNAQLNHLRGRRNELQSKLARLLDSLEDLGGTDVEVRQQLTEKREIVTTAESAVQTATTQHNLAKDTVLALERKLLSSKANRDAVLNELLAAHSRETIDNYEASVQAAQDELLTATEEQEQLSFAHKFFERAIARAKDPEPACLLCEHEKSPDEAARLIKGLAAKIDALSVDPEKAEADTQACRAQVESLRAISGHVASLYRLEAEASSLETELIAAKTELESLRSRVSAATNTYSDAEKAFSSFEMSTMPLLVAVDRCKEELSEATAKLELEENLQGTEKSSTTMTMQEAQQHQMATEQQLRSARSELDGARAEHECLKSRRSALFQNASNLRLRLSEHELRASHVQRFQDDLERVRGTVTNHESNKSAAKAQEGSIERAIKESQAALSAKRFENSQEQKNIAETRNQLMMSLRQFEELHSEVVKFTAEYGDDPLGDLQKERSQAKMAETEMVTAHDATQQEIRVCERLQTDFSGFKRNLQDNLRLRRYESELAEMEGRSARCREALKEAEEQFGNVGRLADYETRTRKLQDRVGFLNHSISKLAGETESTNAQIREVRKELSTTYGDATVRYKRAVAQMQSTAGAVHDLEKYQTALNRSIMRYHGLKMDEINDSLDQMWKQTYTGTDIDTIMLKSEIGKSEGVNARDTQNYRVCMVKRDTVLDMRGRCSAGQKVLASILIRMALAECFGNSSGLIVLDEPTTNLDHENIKALAHSLNDIISMRRAQSNFQLIVITHDEQFLAEMNPASLCNSFFKVTRDARQLSTITKLPISALSIE